MKIETFPNVSPPHWGNTGPARIAPIPAKPSAAAPPLVLPSLRAFALPDVEAPTVDVSKFLTVTAKLLERMDQVNISSQPEQGRRLDILA